jgi:predicted alpha/beta hydrolase family esterase
LGQPLLKDWLESLNSAIRICRGEIIIVAHSLLINQSLVKKNPQK